MRSVAAAGSIFYLLASILLLGRGREPVRVSQQHMCLHPPLTTHTAAVRGTVPCHSGRAKMLSDLQQFATVDLITASTWKQLVDRLRWVALWRASRFHTWCSMPEATAATAWHTSTLSVCYCVRAARHGAYVHGICGCVPLAVQYSASGRQRGSCRSSVAASLAHVQLQQWSN